MNKGTDVYDAVDEWYTDARKKLNLLLKERPEPFRTPQDIQVPLRIMRDAMECEGLLISLEHACGDLWTEHIEEMELKLRGIRDSIGRMVANAIVSGVSIGGYSPEDYGFSVTMHENGFQIDVPYELISMSDLYLLRSKRISALSHLASVREAWTLLISNMVTNIRLQGIYPLRVGKVKVSIEVMNNLPLDPDHFWIRPIIDGLCAAGILLDDNSNHLVFIQEYKTSRTTNHVSIRVTPMST